MGSGAQLQLTNICIMVIAAHPYKLQRKFLTRNQYAINSVLMLGFTQDSHLECLDHYNMFTANVQVYERTVYCCSSQVAGKQSSSSSSSSSSDSEEGEPYSIFPGYMVGSSRHNNIQCLQFSILSGRSQYLLGHTHLLVEQSKPFSSYEVSVPSMQKRREMVWSILSSE